MRRTSIVAFVGLLLVASGAVMPAAGADDGPGRRDAYFTGPQLSMAFSDRLRAMAAESPPEGGTQPDVEREPSMAPPPPGKGPPLPLHNLEGTSGGCITPMAYFANPGPEGTVLAMPSASYTFLLAGSKKVHSIALSTVLWRRIELSYAWNAVDLGSFPNRVFDTGGVTIRDHIYLHNLNVRGMLIEENSFNMPLPSIVAGVHLKIGDGLHSIDHRTGRLPTRLGFDKATGVDFTLMASKTWQDPLLKRPLITSLGVRFTESSQIGWLGFGDDYKANLEANVAWVPTDWLAVAYEYRMKRDQYDTAKPLINGEDDWHTILVAWLINENMSLAAAYGHLGRIANTTEEAAWGVQFKYEF
jgi:hypothetical protein